MCRRTATLPQAIIWLSTDTTSRAAKCSGRWRATRKRSFTKNTRPSSSTPSRSRANMKSSPYSRPWRTVRRATATMILSMRKTRTSLTPMWRNVKNLPSMIRAWPPSTATGSSPSPPANTLPRMAGLWWWRKRWTDLTAKSQRIQRIFGKEAPYGED